MNSFLNLKRDCISVAHVVVMCTRYDLTASEGYNQRHICVLVQVAHLRAVSFVEVISLYPLGV